MIKNNFFLLTTITFQFFNAYSVDMIKESNRNNDFSYNKNLGKIISDIENIFYDKEFKDNLFKKIYYYEKINNSENIKYILVKNELKNKVQEIKNKYSYRICNREINNLQDALVNTIFYKTYCNFIKKNNPTFLSFYNENKKKLNMDYNLNKYKYCSNEYFEIVKEEIKFETKAMMPNFDRQYSNQKDLHDNLKKIISKKYSVLKKFTKKDFECVKGKLNTLLFSDIYNIDIKELYKKIPCMFELIECIKNDNKCTNGFFITVSSEKCKNTSQEIFNFIEEYIFQKKNNVFLFIHNYLSDFKVDAHGFEKIFFDINTIVDSLVYHIFFKINKEIHKEIRSHRNKNNKERLKEVIENFQNHKRKLEAKLLLKTNQLIDKEFSDSYLLYKHLIDLLPEEFKKIENTIA